MTHQPSPVAFDTLVGPPSEPVPWQLIARSLDSLVDWFGSVHEYQVSVYEYHVELTRTLNRAGFTIAPPAPPPPGWTIKRTRRGADKRATRPRNGSGRSKATTRPQR